MNSLVNTFCNKRVLVTGHNGFKGTYLLLWLIEMGAEVIGVSLPNNDSRSLFNVFNLKSKIQHNEHDIRDGEFLKQLIISTKPEIVIHLAAQAIVFEAHNDPYYTFDVNVMGTINLLESIKTVDSVEVVLVITSDKVYLPVKASKSGLKESDIIGGLDPYSASKSMVEILVNSYRKSFFEKQGIRIATARAGNVLGFGDWGKNRLIPDVLNSIITNTGIIIRNPNSIRPWQGINNLCVGYLLLIKYLYEVDKQKEFSFNFGPSNSKVKVSRLVGILKDHFELNILDSDSKSPEENKTLVLDSTLALQKLDWKSNDNIEDLIMEVINHFKIYQENSYQLYNVLKKQILELIKEYDYD